MRSRGAVTTDIVVLVVAADDSVKAQTIEAINHAKAAGCPIIVAVNKCDKPEADPRRVRNDLLQHEIVTEDFGGDILCVDVSAHTGSGLDKLEEAILLQAELLELKANPDRDAEGTVVEAKVERGRGSVATVLVQRGTLRVGDVFVTGAESGRVRALLNDKGKQLKSALPASLLRFSASMARQWLVINFLLLKQNLAREKLLNIVRVGTETNRLLCLPAGQSNRC